MVGLIANDESWYHRVTGFWPWDADTQQRLLRLQAVVGDEAGELIGPWVGQDRGAGEPGQ